MKTVFVSRDGDVYEYRVYAESNGLMLACRVGSPFWEVVHSNTGKPIVCNRPKWNGKAKTRVAEFFDYLARAPFDWNSWKNVEERPSWFEEAFKYRQAF